MVVKSKIFTPVPGTTQISHWTIYGVRILGVSRSGNVLNQVGLLTIPGAPEFKYTLSTIFFDPTNPFILGEKVWVIFED